MLRRVLKLDQHDSVFAKSFRSATKFLIADLEHYMFTVPSPRWQATDDSIRAARDVNDVPSTIQRFPTEFGELPGRDSLRLRKYSIYNQHGLLECEATACQ